MMNMSDSSFLTMTFNKSEQLAVEAFYDRRFPTVVMMILFSIVGIPGNIVVLLVYFRKRLTSTQFLISVIAMVDLFTAGVVLPLTIWYNTAWFSILDVTFCKIRMVAAMIGTYPGLYLIWGVSVVRYYHICRPHELYYVETKVKTFCNFVFGISLSLNGIVYVIMGKQTWTDEGLPGYFCTVSDKYNNGVLYISLFVIHAVLLLFCLITIVIMYCLIVRRVLERQKVRNMYRNSTLNNKCEQLLANEEDRNSTVVFTDVSLASLISHNKSTRSYDKSHVSHESDKQTETTKKQRTLKMQILGDTENTMETTPKPKKNRRKSNQTSSSQNTILSKSRHKTMLVSIIGIVYLLTYVPWLTITVYLMVKKTSRVQMHDTFKYFYIPGQYLCYLGCAANPVVYTFVDPAFRSKCKAMIFPWSTQMT